MAIRCGRLTVTTTVAGKEDIIGLCCGCKDAGDPATEAALVLLIVRRVHGSDHQLHKP